MINFAKQEAQHTPISLHYNLLFMTVDHRSANLCCDYLHLLTGNFCERIILPWIVDGRSIQVDNKTIKAQIWDTAGQERYRAITSA